ncbi:helix-turn-helix domain-containing protein [Chryseobacterium phocaeense]|uniref:helix-turn-helix domain-containing protein n=1 Tax=Chryseobacterium phocaeense TaxID=1816690 RepID=UPI0009BB42D1|nr:helix-turn-helix domain-containing protein [Chryseobacterium phocaeense]
MKKSLYLFILLLFFFSANAQNEQSGTALPTEAIDKKLEEIRFNPKISDTEKEKALLKLKSESEKIGYKWGILKSGRRIIEIYMKQNKNKDIIELSTELKKIDAGPQAVRTMANIYRSSGLALAFLGFHDASLKDFKTAVNYAEKIEDPETRNYTVAVVYQNICLYFFNKRLENRTFIDSLKNYHHKSIETAKLIKNYDEEITAEKKYDVISFNYVRLAISYLEEADQSGNLAIAEKYLMEALNIVTNNQNLKEGDNAILLNQLSWLYIEKKDYKKAMEYAYQALSIEKKFPAPENKVESFEFLASAYSELGDTRNSKLYMDKYSHLKDSLRIAEKNNADHSFNILLSDSKKTEEKKFSFKMIILLVISIILVLTVIVYWKRKNKRLHRKYEEIIAKINSRRENSAMSSVKILTDSEVKTSLNIPDETVKSLLQKLDKFEASEKYLKKEVNLTWLANHLNTNPKYLSEIIKIYREKNFSNYINGLRINFIVDKLYNEPKYREYKISYLAEESGFVTYKVFVAAFKNEHGVTPSYFIEKLKASGL